MNKETKRFLLGSVALLSLVVAGCSTEKKDSETTQVTTAEASTEETTQVTTQAAAQDVSNYKTDGTQPSETFNWEATVAPLKNSESEITRCCIYRPGKYWRALKGCRSIESKGTLYKDLE